MRTQTLRYLFKGLGGAPLRPRGNRTAHCFILEPPLSLFVAPLFLSSLTLALKSHSPASAGVGSDDGMHASDLFVCLYATGEAPWTTNSESGGLDGAQATGRVETIASAAFAGPTGCASVQEVLAHEAARELHVRYWRLESHTILSWRR